MAPVLLHPSTTWFLPVMPITPPTIRARSSVLFSSASNAFAALG